MGKYSNGKIYKLVNDVNDEIYVGSTCNSLSKRIAKHRYFAKTKPSQVHRCMNVIGWDNVKIILIEEYPCDNRMQLERRERYWIDELKPSLNKALPGRTYEEWKEENKEMLQQYMKEYNLQHKDTKREYDKKYREDNAEKRKQQEKEFYEKNKDKINEERKKKMKCDCGCEVRKDGMKEHLKTTKHQQWLSNQPSTSST